MKINGVEITAKMFVYDGCHKIYIVETTEELHEATDHGYNAYPIAEIEEAYRNSCGLEFISNWSLNKHYVEQGEKAEFE